MNQFIDWKYATIERLAALGGPWIVDRRPPTGAANFVWEVAAEEGDSLYRLLERLLYANGGPRPLPRSTHGRAMEMHEALRRSIRPVLVIRDAHLLPAGVLRLMRPWSKRMAPVILIGDVLTIAAAVITDRAFMQRAMFCVKVESMWDTEETMIAPAKLG